MSSGKTLQSVSPYNNQPPPTPSLAKRKKIQEKSAIRSPTDSVMSPCTRQLMKKAIKDIPSSPRPRREAKENTANK